MVREGSEGVSVTEVVEEFASEGEVTVNCRVGLRSQPAERVEDPMVDDREGRASEVRQVAERAEMIA